MLTLAFRVPMDRYFGDAYGYQLATWYPRLDEAWNGAGPEREAWSRAGPGRSTIHARIQSPKTDTVVASGRLVRRTAEDKAAFTEWDTEDPYVNVGFRSGQYGVRSGIEGGVQIDLYTPRGGESGAAAAGTLATVRNAVRLFTAYFGPLPFATLRVFVAPPLQWTGSWPMLISLGTDAFVRAETVRAKGRGILPLYSNSGIHEIAHQWWPHLIGYSSYRDEWLAEGCAQFAAAIYAHRAEGEKALVQFLEQDREGVLSPTNGMNDAGPIWLGRRLRLDKNAFGANFLLRAKGGYVLHMLRMMLYDFKTDDDSRFIRMMKDYSATYKFKNASTEDFKAIVDKHFAQDMGWFFNQWVYGSEVPAVEVEYALNPNEGGVRLEGVLRQAGVSPGFAIEMPVLMRFGPAKIVGRIRAFGAETRFHMQLPQRPDTLEFNPLGAVLCRLKVKPQTHGNK